MLSRNRLLIHCARADHAELRLILVGKSGGGKSATGNTILGWKEFKSILSAKSTTLRCQRGQGSWQGKTISVVDTPGMFNSDDYSEGVRREVMPCIEFSRPGPHALILVTQVERFSAEDAAAVKCVQDIFGAESTRCTIVLFTRIEDLGGIPLKEYVRKSDNKNLRDVIRQCRNRFCGFNNKATEVERDNQVSDLMETVQRTVSENGGGYYTNQLYLEPILMDGIVKAFLAKNKKARKMAENALKWKEFFFIAAIITTCFITIYILIKSS
ncbi:PREDICTED: GTPase IMAP family member 5-like [Thamnophis sirtalis]|uniref:GTPase IMAP family member 5-like n=1 Tax=Thamnophis sirtalis TaxID=35019 RepID=A0A6I9YRT7_9SAUR|nr:PREDICTED: GTPase IMAP family member 5-like [Thamnophis sirtalis]